MGTLQQFDDYVKFLRNNIREDDYRKKMDYMKEIFLKWTVLSEDKQEMFAQILQDLLLDINWQIRLLSASILTYLNYEPENQPMFLVATLNFNELQTQGPEIIEQTYKLLGNYPEVWINSRLITSWYRVDNAIPIIDELLKQNDLHDEEKIGLQVVKGKVTGEYLNSTHELLADNMIKKDDTNLNHYPLNVIKSIEETLNEITKVGNQFLEVLKTTED